jgi:hypothetical protein
VETADLLRARQGVVHTQKIVPIKNAGQVSHPLAFLMGIFLPIGQVRKEVKNATNVRNWIDSERLNINRFCGIWPQVVEIRPGVQAHKKEKRAF